MSSGRFCRWSSSLALAALLLALAACGPGPRSPAETARALLEALAARDYAALRDLVAPDYLTAYPEMLDARLGRLCQGLDGAVVETRTYLTDDQGSGAEVELVMDGKRVQVALTHVALMRNDKGEAAESNAALYDRLIRAARHMDGKRPVMLVTMTRKGRAWQVTSTWHQLLASLLEPPPG